ncbi:MAG: ACP S-malonyltransferase [Parvularculaceae bacterium]
MARAFVFPGQGSQTVGMGRALAESFPAAREVFEEVDDAVGRRLSAIIWDGPMEALTLTANAQPALMAHSIAMLRVLEKEAGVDIENAMFLAGHSLGEYTALCAARAIRLADTARLLRVRGEAMQDAVPAGEGAMAALIGVDLEAAQKAIDAAPSAGVCEIANDNAPGQVVISGDKARVEAVCAGAKAFGVKMAKLLPVSAPFHCSLMAPAAAKMQKALEKAAITAPLTPVIANVTAREATSPADIRALLVKQVTGRVRWTESVLYMTEKGCDAFVEIGAGKVLAGLIKRIAKDAKTISVGEPADIEAFAKW